jgi:hypothetical protein
MSRYVRLDVMLPLGRFGEDVLRDVLKGSVDLVNCLSRDRWG